MHRRSGGDDEPMAEMNFIPLIDIALTLVIILMVTTAFIRHPGVALKLPETVTREGTPETNKDTVIAVTADGTLYLNAEKQTPEQLQGRLISVAKRDKQARILIKGDRAVQHGAVMDVLDRVRVAGLTRVVFPTDPKKTAEQLLGSQTPPASAGGSR
jgi:biopolymer transport protein ExbD